jgi:hypothetical protein
MSNTYNINYDDERFTQVENEKQQALTQVEQAYGGMIEQSDQYYQAQIDASKEWVDKQSQLQQENTDFAIEQIEQQKAQAQKDYTKEQSGAYVDWQKQSNQYGANAEQMAMNGMMNGGYSESSQVAMYNQYQNRVATAREVFNKAVLNYDNGIKDAILQNNSKLAEISYQGLQQQLELALQGFQYKNSLIETQLNKKTETEDRYYQRYQDVLSQMNQENAMAEQVRQYNESMALEQKKLQEEIRQFEQSYTLQVKEYEEGIRQFNVEIERLKKKDAQEYAMEIQRLELQKQQLAEEKRQFNASYSLQKKQYEQQQQQLKIAREQNEQPINKTSDKQQVKTKYYSGDIAENVGGFGYMAKDENGVAYQPKGVYIDGKAYKLSEYGTAGTLLGGDITNSSGVNIAKQNVWEANGHYYIWNGTKNQYEEI